MYLIKSMADKLIIKMSFGSNSPIVQVQEVKSSKQPKNMSTVALFTCGPGPSSAQPEPSRRRSTECTISYRPKVEGRYSLPGNVRRLTDYFEDINKEKENQEASGNCTLENCEVKCVSTTTCTHLISGTNMSEDFFKNDPKIETAFATISDMINSTDSGEMLDEFSFNSAIHTPPSPLSELETETPEQILGQALNADNEKKIQREFTSEEELNSDVSTEM